MILNYFNIDYFSGVTSQNRTVRYQVLLGGFIYFLDLDLVVFRALAAVIKFN